MALPIVENLEGWLRFVERIEPNERGERLVRLHEIDLKLIEAAVKIVKERTTKEKVLSE